MASERWVHEIEIPRTTPSGNVTRREHWAKSHERAALWRTEMMVALAANRDIKAQAPYTRVHIISYRKKKLDKFDNLPFGMKEIIPDNLIKVQLIMDDDDSYCDITCEQVIVNGEKPRTVIKLGHNERTGQCEKPTKRWIFKNSKKN